MADMVKNKIICKKEIGDKVLSSDETGKYFDFNLLIPMAEELNISGYKPMLGLLYYLEKHPEKARAIKKAMEKKQLYGYGGISTYWDYMQAQKCWGALGDLEKYAKEYVPSEDCLGQGIRTVDDFAQRLYDNIEAYGYSHWCDWRLANWGTKWPACDNKIKFDERTGKYTIKFETADRMPMGILTAYSKLCAPGELYWVYRNEGAMCATRFTNPDGELLQVNVSPGKVY